jgi:hypothetical protein
MKRPNLNLHIKELVLHGFAPNDRYAIADAVQQELSRLLGTSAEQSHSDFESTLIQHSSNARLDAGAFQVEQNSKPTSLGNQIAQAVHGGLTK